MHRISRPRSPQSPTQETRARLALLHVFAVILASLIACSDSETADAPASGSHSGSADSETPTANGSPPSVVLIVTESLRTDAVGSYGKDRQSPLPLGDFSVTPHIDEIATRGTRYAWAIAASPSTVTSHASIFTGLPPQEHGAGLWTEIGAPEELEMLAETLAAKGYETVGFSENPIAGPAFGLDQGFDRFVTPEPVGLAERLREGNSGTRDFKTLSRIKRWLKDRDTSRPYFLFVNLADAHLPWEHRAQNRFLPKGLSQHQLDDVLALRPQQFRICRRLPHREALEVLAALYLEEVAAADRKIGEIDGLLREHAESSKQEPPITVVTADHGTHLGEQKMLGHEFAVDNRALHVPLIVAGMDPTASPGVVVETPIAQRRLAHSIRCWAGDESDCEEGLPRDDADAADRETSPIISIAGNDTKTRPPAYVVDSGFLDGQSHYASAFCELEDGYWGRAVSYFDPPHKFVWRQYGPEALYDLSWDPSEKSDQIERRKDLADSMKDEVLALIDAKRLDKLRRFSSEDRPLGERAAEAFLAGREAMLADQTVATDIVWFAQQILKDRPDPKLEAWVKHQIPLKKEDMYYPIIDPTRISPIEVPEELPGGLMKFGIYLLAAVGGPESRALPIFEEYLALENATGYVLTHQLSGLEWARAMGRPFPDSTYARSREFTDQIAIEHASDHRFRDLWAERAAFLTLFADPSEEDLARWTDIIVESHLGDGDWGHFATDMTFDGETRVGEHPRAHVRGMSMIVLSRYLSLNADEGLPDWNTNP